jgi:hypothetical protein
MGSKVCNEIGPVNSRPGSERWSCCRGQRMQWAAIMAAIAVRRCRDEWAFLFTEEMDLKREDGQLDAKRLGRCDLGASVVRVTAWRKRWGSTMGFYKWRALRKVGRRELFAGERILLDMVLYIPIIPK